MLAARGPSEANAGFTIKAPLRRDPVKIILLLFACSFSSCSYHYENPQNANADYGRDRCECERENTRYESRIEYVVGMWPQSVTVPVTDWVMVGDCMSARGWRRAG